MSKVTPKPTNAPRINDRIQPCTKCRACGSSLLDPSCELFSIGNQWVSSFITNKQSSNYKNDEIAYPKIPITLLQCAQCTLIQQKFTAPQDFLYTRHYWYKSGTTQTMRDALSDVVRWALGYVKIRPGDIVLDIGSNDGQLLRSYDSTLGVFKVGVEPATNFDDACNGVDILINDFWSYQAYTDAIDFQQEMNPLPINSKRPKIITACGMFYDLENPNQFIADIAKTLHPEGIFIAQLMCAKQMFAMKDVGNLAHEHIEFYTLESLRQLFKKHGLAIIDIEENTVNGGSYRIYARLSTSKLVVNSDRIIHFYQSEVPLLVKETWLEFYRHIEQVRSQTRDFIWNQRCKGKRTGVIGASTKGNVILQYYGLDNRTIDFASEIAKDKIGKRTIGTDITIVSEEEARLRNPHYLFVLPYAFLQEFIEREKDWRRTGGRFIVSIPEFAIV